jgi:hypothetical protein
MTFALFFLGEYGNMILVSVMTAILFLGGWLPLFDVAPFTWVPGPDLVTDEDPFRDVLHPLGARDISAISLRPADAARLESVPAVLAAVAGVDYRGPDGISLGPRALNRGDCASMVSLKVDR